MKRTFALAALLVAGCAESGPVEVAPLVVQGALLDAPLEPREEEVATAAPTTPAEPEPEPEPEEDEEPVGSPENPRFLAFEDLQYAYYGPINEQDPDDPPISFEDFPEELRALNGQTVSIDGYMLPMRLDGDRVETFLMTQFLANCCFGGGHAPDEWILVDVPEDEVVHYIPNTPIRVTGPLEVGEVRDEDGFVQTLYQVTGTVTEEEW